MKKLILSIILISQLSAIEDIKILGLLNNNTIAIKDNGLVLYIRIRGVTGISTNTKRGKTQRWYLNKLIDEAKTVRFDDLTRGKLFIIANVYFNNKSVSKQLKAKKLDK